MNNEPANNPPALQPFVIVHTVNALPGAVWQAWTDPERIRQWWGPKGGTVEHCVVDLVPGGVNHYRLSFSDGRGMWGKFIYREIVAPERLVYVSSFSDASGGITRHANNADWPLEMLTTVTFRECNGGTTVTVEWLPLNATEAEKQAFDTGREVMRKGWAGSLQRLGEYFA